MTTTTLLRLVPLALASVLAASGCVVVSDDGEDSGNDSGNDTGNDTSSASSAASDADASASGSDGADSDGTAADTTSGAGSCGWGATGDDGVPDGYICEGNGPDPSGRFEMACPEDVTLEVGGECGSVPGPGCCGPDGDAWFCGDPGDGPVLARIDC